MAQSRKSRGTHRVMGKGRARFSLVLQHPVHSLEATTVRGPSHALPELFWAFTNTSVPYTALNLLFSLHLGALSAGHVELPHSGGSLHCILAPATVHLAALSKWCS